MKKAMDTQLIKQLINLDFPIVKSKRGEKDLGTIVKSLYLKENKYSVLDLFKLNNSLKQFLRILFALRNPSRYIYKRIKNRRIKFKNKRKSKFYIYIWCRNKFILQLINKFIQQYKIRKYIKLCTLFPTINYCLAHDKKKFLFVLGNPWSRKPAKMTKNRILFNKIFLVNSLNFLNEKSNLGFYKIQNDLADYKKLLVILVLIENVIGKWKL